MISPCDRDYAHCGRTDRRGFLRTTTHAAAGLSLSSFLARTQRLANGGVPTRDVGCIFIWTQGGTRHHDTLDPKPLASDGIRGPLQAIPTSVPGVQFTEACPRMARELQRFSLMRSWNPKNAGHGVADQWCMSGRHPNPAIAYPCVGSVISHQQGFKSALPPFVQLGSYVDRTFHGGTPGILGLEHGAFEIPNEVNVERFHVRDITPPLNMELTRIERRQSILKRIDAMQKAADLQPAAFDALDEHYKTAFNMITAPETKAAFDIGSEKPELRDAYGRTPFGQRLLLARRLIESGVRFVTVSDPGWDNHVDCFDAMKIHRMPQVDQALPQLFIDLEERGMLDNTLVVWMTDFGRTPKINSANGRDHWATAGFVVAGGAGIPGGLVIGSTDAEGSAPASDEYLTDQIVATIYEKMGLPLDLTIEASDGRPVRLIEAEPVREWI